MHGLSLARSVGSEMNRLRLILVALIAFSIAGLVTWASQPNAPTFHIRTDGATQVHLMSDVSYATPNSNGGGGTGGSGSSTSSEPLRLKAMGWALQQQGCWYEWGGTGPCAAGFDCSGLVYESYLHYGVDIGRDTYDMLANKHLVRVRPSQIKRGYLAFFGTGHVELVWQPHWHRTYGAQRSGTRVGSHKWDAYWHPTMFFKIVRR